MSLTLRGFAFIFFSMTLFSSLCGVTSENIRSQIFEKLKASDYKQLGILLKNKVKNNEISLRDVRKIALLAKSKPLLQALDATVDFSKQAKGIDLPESDFLQIALFIETQLSSFTTKGASFLPKSKTSLSRTLEHDPQTHNTFIVVDDAKGAFIGEGHRKKVYKSICYNNANGIAKAKIIARAEQRGGMANEIAITQALHASSGVFSMLGAGGHKKNGRHYTTMYSELYNGGDLKEAFLNKTKFSLYEKMQIALTLLQGLEAMQSHQIVHRDLGAKNIFLNISEGTPGKRRVQAAIADFGCAKFISDMHKKRAQVGMRHTAPEAIFFNKLKGQDFFATDVYAAGLVLYHLYYEERPSWVEKPIDRSLPLRVIHKDLIHKINKHTQSRRRLLTEKKTKNQLSPEEEFELMILQMLNTNAECRPTSSKLRKTMQSILSSHVANSQKFKY